MRVRKNLIDAVCAFASWSPRQELHPFHLRGACLRGEGSRKEGVRMEGEQQKEGCEDGGRRRKKGWCEDGGRV